MTAGISSTATPEGFGLLTVDDPWVRERHRWVAELPGGSRVYMDDGRTDASPRSAWARLGMFCRATGTPVVGLRLQFRSNVIWLPPGREGYFFSRATFGVYGEEASHDGFVAGYLEGGVVRTARYRLPGLEPLDAGERPPDPCNPCLIVNPVVA